MVRFQFSLRTCFIAITLIAMACAYWYYKDQAEKHEAAAREALDAAGIIPHYSDGPPMMNLEFGRSELTASNHKTIELVQFLSQVDYVKILASTRNSDRDPDPRAEPYSAAELDHLLAMLAYVSETKGFTLSCDSLSDENAQRLSCIRGVKGLSLYLESHADETAQRLDRIQGLESLSIICDTLSEESLRRLGRVQGLKDLMLTCESLSVKSLQQLGQIPGLETLQLIIRRNSLENLDFLKPCQTLTKCELTCSTPSLKINGGPAALKQLDIRDDELTVLSISELPALAELAIGNCFPDAKVSLRLKSLRKLTVSEDLTPDIDFGQCTELKELSVGVGTDSLLRSLPSCQKLERLDIDLYWLRNRQDEFWRATAGLSKLESLSLRNIGQKQQESVRNAVSNLKSLKRLHLITGAVDDQLRNDCAQRGVKLEEY